MSQLFTPFSLKDVTLRNRIAVPPMCQYMATDGFVSDWHGVHYASLARGGAGLVIVEATAVSPDGRITPKCLGLWDDAHIEGLAKIAAAIKKAGAVPGIQIGHAGRKGCANVPWEGDDHIAPEDPRAWQILGPSAVAYGAQLNRAPKAMSLEEIARVREDFAVAAKRAHAAGFEWLELHFAHGYLAESFASPHANKRSDAYGGSAEKRGRFALETLDAVRKVWPENLPLTARFGVIEYDGREEESLSESIALVKRFRDGGLDFLNVSLRFNSPADKIPWGKAFLAPVAKRVREATHLPVASAWGFGFADAAEAAVAGGTLDVVMAGKAHLANPFWAYQVARELGQEKPNRILPPPYAHWLNRYK